MVGGLQALGFAALGSRLYYLSILNGDTYKLRAESNRISRKLIVPERGEILDRQGRKLATNQQDFRVLLVPEQAGDVEAVLERIGSIVHLEERRKARLLRQIKRQPRFWSITVADRLDWQTFSRLNVGMPDLPGVTPDAGLSRHYPSGGDFSHIVGYLGDPPKEAVDRNPLFREPGFKVGREGIEDQYDDTLRGKQGERHVEVNAYGREIRELPPRSDAERGQDIRLTIDANLQRFTVQQLGEEAAGAVVIDIRTGDIVSMVSTPTYNPNEFTRGMSNENWQGLLSDPRKPLVNKATGGQFAPGSTIKMIVALAALNKGIISEDTSFFCGGKHKVGNHTFHCWKRGGHGRLSMKEAIAQSCDVYFYKLAEQLDIDDLAAMGRKFGLGQTFDLPIESQRGGVMPTRDWKEQTQRAPWQKGDTVNAAIGQGYVLATPLQLAVMTARIASGLAVTPRLVRSVGEWTGGGQDGLERIEGLDTNPLHMASIRRAMEMVTEEGGTAHDYRRPREAAPLAGKTGTAQVRRITESERQSRVLKNEELPWRYRDHALYVGYGPTPDPRLAVAVLVQHGGGGSSTAAPIARRVLDEGLRLINLEDREGQA